METIVSLSFAILYRGAKKRPDGTFFTLKTCDAEFRNLYLDIWVNCQTADH